MILNEEEAKAYLKWSEAIKNSVHINRTPMGNPSKETIEFNKDSTFADGAVKVVIIILAIAFIGVFAYGLYKLMTL